MVKIVHSNGQAGLFTKETSKTIKDMAKERWFIMMVTLTKELSRETNFMAKGHSPMPAVRSTRADGSSERNAGRARWSTRKQMARKASTRVAGETTSVTVEG